MDVQDRIIFLRNKAGLNQSELARRAGVSQNYINQIEKKKRQCPIDTLQKICEALKITLSDFFAEEIESIPVPTDVDIEQIEILKGANVTTDELKRALKVIEALKLNQD